MTSPPRCTCGAGNQAPIHRRYCPLWKALPPPANDNGEEVPAWLFLLACVAVLLALVALGKFVAGPPDLEVLIDEPDAPAIAAAVSGGGAQPRQPSAASDEPPIACVPTGLVRPSPLTKEGWNPA